MIKSKKVYHLIKDVCLSYVIRNEFFKSTYYKCECIGLVLRIPERYNTCTVVGKYKWLPSTKNPLGPMDDPDGSLGALDSKKTATKR